MSVNENNAGKGLRLRAWLTEHSIWQHVAAPVWKRIPEKRRWRIVDRLNKSQGRCWSDLVTDALCWDRDLDACDIPVPALRSEKSPRCASVCDWGHSDHAGEHDCSCYCGKFQFRAAEGSIDRGNNYVFPPGDSS